MHQADYLDPVTAGAGESRWPGARRRSPVPAEIAGLDRLGPASWAPGSGHRFIRSCPASSPGAGGAWRGTDRPGGSWSGTRHSSAVPVPAGFADLTDLSADAMSSSTEARSTGPHTGRMADLERAHPRAAHSALRRNDRVAECSACSSSPREAGLGAIAAGDRNAEWITFPASGPHSESSAAPAGHREVPRRAEVRGACCARWPTRKWSPR